MVDVRSDTPISDDEIKRTIIRSVDFTPNATIDRLDLRRPIYAQTARFGHFGIASYPWEQTVGLLKREE